MPRFAIACMHLQESELHMEIQEGKDIVEASSKIVKLAPYIAELIELHQDLPNDVEQGMTLFKQVCLVNEMFVNWVEV